MGNGVVNMFDFMQEFYDYFGLNFFDGIDGAITVIDWVTWVVKIGISLSVFKCFLHCLADVAGFATRGIR